MTLVQSEYEFIITIHPHPLKGDWLALQDANGQDSQIWEFKHNSFESAVPSDNLHRKLVLDLMWMDVPMITGNSNFDWTRGSSCPIRMLYSTNNNALIGLLPAHP